MAGNSSFKIKWLEKPEYKCLSQIQNKFKAASCNVCIKDINISNIGGRVDLKVTFSQQSTLNIKKKQFETQCGLIIKWDQPVSSLQKKIIGGVCGNNRFHKSGDLILTLNMVKSYFSFTSYIQTLHRFFRVCSQPI